MIRDLDESRLLNVGRVTGEYYWSMRLEASLNDALPTPVEDMMWIFVRLNHPILSSLAQKVDLAEDFYDKES